MTTGRVRPPAATESRSLVGVRNGRLILQHCPNASLQASQTFLGLLYPYAFVYHCIPEMKSTVKRMLLSIYALDDSVSRRDELRQGHANICLRIHEDTMRLPSWRQAIQPQSQPFLPVNAAGPPQCAGRHRARLDIRLLVVSL